MNQFLPTGEIVNTHGIRGEVRVLPWADCPEFLTEFDVFYVDGKPMEVELSRVQKTCVLVKFRGVDTVEAASRLRGKVVEICREDVELEKGTFFVADLEGLTVRDQNGNTLGKVTEVLSMPGNDVYVVKGGKEYMIPAVKEYVKNIDIEAGVMDVVLIEGMQTDAD